MPDFNDLWNLIFQYCDGCEHVSGDEAGLIAQAAVDAARNRFECIQSADASDRLTATPRGWERIEADDDLHASGGSCTDRSCRDCFPVH